MVHNFLLRGVVIGSAVWWLLLSGTVGLFQKRFDLQRLRWLNRLSGLVIILFGLITLGSLR